MQILITVGLYIFAITTSKNTNIVKSKIC